MSGSLVADSSALVSLVSETDSNHHTAIALSKKISEAHLTVILPSDVFSETVNILGKKTTHEIASRTAEMLLHSDSFPIVEANNEIREDAFDLFRKQSSAVSFTDCIVMAFVGYFGASEIFGFDGHFPKNGYKLLQ